MSSQIFLILLSLPVTIISVYVSVRGSPVNSTSYASKTFLNLTWKSCITRYVIVANCILVHSNILNTCYLYAVGDIIQVRNDRDGYSIMNDTVAFRMRNSPFECSNRSSGMLFGVINPYNMDNITSYEITMSPTNEYYEIKYGSISMTCSMNFTTLLSSKTTFKIEKSSQYSGFHTATAPATLTEIQWISE